jgi:hypothetical protein
MQTAADLEIPWSPTKSRQSDSRTAAFVLSLAACTACSAVLASWLPLQVSVITVFLFAGPHNWFELRYFLMRVPARFGKSRTFFVTAFSGVGVLSLTYFSLPLLFRYWLWTQEWWSIVIASWNSLLLCWLGLLVWLRARQKPHSNWSWFPAVLLATAALNWLGPMLFSLAVVYVHPLVALWFFDRHLARTRPEWLPAYRRFLFVLPAILVLMIWQLSRTSPLADDNGLFWRITQHSGAGLLPMVSSHLLVTVHLFLEMLHYGVWLIALPLIAPIASAPSQPLHRRIWSAQSLPLVRHPRGFPRLITTAMVFAALLVVALWLGFSVDYTTTRDIYFTVAITHVLAEAPFLLKML